MTMTEPPDPRIAYATTTIRNQAMAALAKGLAVSALEPITSPDGIAGRALAIMVPLWW
jgi:hypothetical protein